MIIISRGILSLVLVGVLFLSGCSVFDNKSSSFKEEDHNKGKDPVYNISIEGNNDFLH